MKEDANTFNTPANTSGWRSLSLTETFRVTARTFRLFARVVGVVLFGCLTLISLFALQVAALELSDRLNIFPLYGFFSINLLCGLFLTWLIVKSRSVSSTSNQGVVRTAIVKPRRSRKLWAGILGVLSVNKAKAQTPTAARPVAVLLIIKRQAQVESKRESRAASA
jgi:hypothetical protein